MKNINIALLLAALLLAPFALNAQTTQPRAVAAKPSGAVQAAPGGAGTAAAAAAPAAAAPAAEEAQETPEEAIKRGAAERAEAQRAAAAKRADDAKKDREARIAKCQIKPVMTDDEIAYCRSVSFLN